MGQAAAARRPTDVRGMSSRGGSTWDPRWPKNNTTRGGARFDWRGSLNRRATSLYTVDPKIRTMMQIYASAARLRSSGAQSFDRHGSHAMVRATATSDRAWRIVT